MRTISILGIILGIFVVGVSVWRWMIFYDSPFRFVVGLFVAVSIMAWAYIIDWITGENKWGENIENRIDSLIQEVHGKYEQLDVKIQELKK